MVENQSNSTESNSEGDDVKVPSSVDRIDDPCKSVDSTGVLRWWPAAILLLVMAGLRSLLVVVDAPSLALMLLGFIGSGVVGLLLLAWWLFASRATAKEKLVVMAGFVVIAVAICSTLHPSLQGMGIVLFVLPTGCAAFGLGALLTACLPKVRVPVVLITTLIGFGAWAILQAQGFDGKIRGDFLWRWEPTNEDNFLASLSDRKSADGTPVAASEFSDPEWPEFRGKDRTGVVSGIVLSEDWDTTPPKEIWRTTVGPGWSSFSVAGNHVFTQEQRGDREAVICLDAGSGAIVWEHDYESRFWEAIGGAGPRATPTIAAGGLFALGGDGILLKLDPSTGKEFWKRDVKVDAERKPPTWGFASSPYVTGSIVVIHAGGKGNKGVLAYDIESGEMVWSAPSGQHSYSSPQAGEFDGVSGILLATDNGVQFLSADDGTIIWQYDWKQEDYRVVQPLVFGNSVLVGASLGTGARRITVTRSENTWNVAEDWDTRNIKPDFNDSVLYHGFVYGFDSGIFCCVDVKTGDRAWKRGRYGNGQVLLLAEKGQLLVTSEKGQLVLIKATPEKLMEVAKLEVFDGKTWNHPVLVGNRLYVRNGKEAACFEMPIQSLDSPDEPQ